MERRLETTNIVVTRIIGGVKQPIFSCEKGEPGASAKVAAHISASVSDAMRSGSAVPEFSVTEEYAKANPDGTVLIAQRSTPLDPTTLKPLQK